MSPTKENEKIWPVVVIGGGASGLMAAATAADSGTEVLLLEKNQQLGKKLSITGGGRCNITNNKPEVRTMLAEYKKEGKFLFSTFSQHGVKDSVEWFSARGVPLKEENERRLFPKTESAQTVVDTLVAEIRKKKVEIKTGQHISEVAYDNEKQFFVVHSSEGQVYAKACILAVGGSARPDTGSTGDGFVWLKDFGHRVVPNNSALVPLTLKSPWTKKLSGLSLSDVRVSIYAYDKKQSTHNGRMLFTHVGVTGPLILNLSKEVGDFLDHTDVTLSLDVFPQYEAGELKSHIAEWLSSNKKLYNALAEQLPLQLVKGILSEISIDGETPCHSVMAADRRKLLNYLQHIPLPVQGLLGKDKAVISSGGVVLEEVDFKTMESKLVPGLYIIGDLLNINRPSGGYSLQLCWSTGYVAGKNAGEVGYYDK